MAKKIQIFHYVVSRLIKTEILLWLAENAHSSGICFERKWHVDHVSCFALSKWTNDSSGSGVLMRRGGQECVCDTRMLLHTLIKVLLIMKLLSITEALKPADHQTVTFISSQDEKSSCMVLHKSHLGDQNMMFDRTDQTSWLVLSQICTSEMHTLPHELPAASVSLKVKDGGL